MFILGADRDLQYIIEDIMPLQMDLTHRIGGIEGMTDDVYDLELAGRVAARTVACRVRTAVDMGMHDLHAPYPVAMPEESGIGIVEEHDGYENHRENIAVFAFPRNHLCKDSILWRKTGFFF